MTTGPDLREELEFIYSVLAVQAEYDGELHPDLGFADLGLDSLGLITLLVEGEDHFEVALDETDEAGLLTVGDLALALHRRRDGIGDELAETERYTGPGAPTGHESRGADR